MVCFFFILQLVFSVIVPSSTLLYFQTYQQPRVCTALTAGWDAVTPNINCTVTSATLFNGTNVLASGYALFNFTSTNVPAANISAATALRDARVAALTTNATAVFAVQLPGTTLNCGCNGMGSVAASGAAPFNYNVNVTVGPMQCGARLIYDPSNLNAIFNQVGVDDGLAVTANLGKFCSTPPVSNGVLGVPGTGNCRQYGVVGGGPDGTSQAYVNSNLGVSVLNGNLMGANFTGGSAGSGYTIPPPVTVSAPDPVPVAATYFLDANARPSGLSTFTSTSINTSNGPYKSIPVATIIGAICVDTGTLGDGTGAICGGPVTTILDAQLITRKGRLCRSEDFNTPVACGPLTSLGPCIFLSQTIITNVFYPGSPYTYCTSAPIVTFSNTLQDPLPALMSATLASGGVISALIVLSNGSGYRTPPTITIAPPFNAQYGKLCSPNPITMLPAVYAYATPVPLTALGFCQPLGRNTVSNRTCSDPVVAGGEKGSLNVYTCNVQSSFIPQPGSTVSNACGILPQTFTIPGNVIAAPSPPPVPTPGPSSPPSPPVASPPPAKTCTYDGIYRLESSGCLGQYIIYNMNSNACNNISVWLGVSNQSTGQWSQWELKGSATAGNIPAASSIVALGRASSCKGTKAINLSSATNAPIVRLGNSASKLRIKPIGINNCNAVSIQATSGKYNNKFLSFKPPCSGNAQLSWTSSSTSASVRWNLKKISS